MNRKILLFDTETTGLLAAKMAPIEKQPYLTEICCIMVDENFKIIEELETFIKPEIPIPDFISRITGITEDTVKDARSFAEVRSAILYLFNEATEIVAHNLPFDKSVLHYNFKRIGEKIPFKQIQTCTIQKSMSLTGRRLSLQNLHKHLFGEGFDGAHRARVDVEAMIRCYTEMRVRGLCE